MHSEKNLKNKTSTMAVAGAVPFQKVYFCILFPFNGLILIP